MSKAEELHLRSKTMELSVELLNDFGFYLHAEGNSPVEDQLEAALDERVSNLMKDGAQGMGGHVLLCLVAMLHQCADPDEVQRFLDEQATEILRQAEEHRAN
jgi:hypothetical protein